MNEDPNRGVLRLANRAPWEQSEFPAKEIIDAGFLELVRYGIRKAGDPLMEDSLKVVDALLKVETPVGPCWRRYNHDGYGQRSDGSSYQYFGKGRPWPLLTGERGHYELAAGRPAEPYLKAIEGFAHGAGLLPEQIWDEPDLPEKYMIFGRTTGAAIPLMWAHAEYVKLLRSSVQGRVFDLIEPVAERYLKPRIRTPLEVWKFHRQVQKVKAGTTLRVLGRTAFMLRWTMDNWATATNSESKGTSLGSNFVDLQIPNGQSGKVCFTFFWKERNEWEGKDFRVNFD
jgi:glucoamylase